MPPSQSSLPYVRATTPSAPPLRLRRSSPSAPRKRSPIGTVSSASPSAREQPFARWPRQPTSAVRPSPTSVPLGARQRGSGLARDDSAPRVLRVEVDQVSDLLLLSDLLSEKGSPFWSGR